MLSVSSLDIGLMYMAKYWVSFSNTFVSNFFLISGIAVSIFSKQKLPLSSVVKGCFIQVDNGGNSLRLLSGESMPSFKIL